VELPFSPRKYKDAGSDLDHPYERKGKEKERKVLKKIMESKCSTGK